MPRCLITIQLLETQADFCAALPEGAPYAVLERPVLTTDSDGVSTSVHHNYTGKFYVLGNIDHAVTEALELMKEPVLREQIRDQAKRHVERFQSAYLCDEFCRPASIDRVVNP